MRHIASLFVALALAAIPTAAIAGELPETGASTQAKATGCDADGCRYRMTAAQLLAQAEKLVAEHRFADAAPLLTALENAPDLAMERDFLKGYSAVETGDFDTAVKLFRRILASQPDQTRVRLELGRALMMQGKPLGAAHHFKLAQQDAQLPEDIANTVRATRNVLRQQKSWSFSLDFGFAPDSNITNGTNAETIDVNLGQLVLPLTLDASARSKSGTGQFASIGGAARLGFVGESRLLVEGQTNAVNYSGKAQDDISTELAAGPEFDLNDDTTLSVQALGSQRWYGGDLANTGTGVRIGLQKELDRGQRAGLSFDARRNWSGLSSAFSGWQFGGYASYERVIGRSLIASASLFGRRESVTAKPYSSIEAGGSIGIGGELPLGINAGMSLGASRAWFDAPLTVFSAEPRRDWRLNARAQVGLRTLRVLGFSPSFTYQYSAGLSSLKLYDNKRSRLRFSLARYF